MQSTVTPLGSSYPLLPGIRSRTILSSRLLHHIYEYGYPSHPALILLHGNLSTGRFYEHWMVRFTNYYVIAPDMRCFGATEAKPVDAIRGLRDFSDDLEALVISLNLQRFHLFGWSLGGGISMQYTIDHPQRVVTLTLQAPSSPFGYAGTHGLDGILVNKEYSGTGAGMVNPSVILAFSEKDKSDKQFTPRSMIRSFYVKKGFVFPSEQEDILVEQVLMTSLGPQYYPGDSVTVSTWPFTGPGTQGVNNTLSPKYCNLTPLADIPGEVKPPILIVYGANDVVVSDQGLFDPAVLGKLGILPGWPGEQIYPSHPMVSQTRRLLQLYQEKGGKMKEVVLSDCGHSPHLEYPDKLYQLVSEHLKHQGKL